MEEIQLNTCKPIPIDQLFVKDVSKLKKEYEKQKELLKNEIIKELMQEFPIRDENPSNSK